MSIRVTVFDAESDETETTEIVDDYVLVTAGTCHLEHTNAYPASATVVLTIKGRRSKGAQS